MYVRMQLQWESDMNVGFDLYSRNLIWQYYNIIIDFGKPFIQMFLFKHYGPFSTSIANLSFDYISQFFFWFHDLCFLNV